MGVNVIDDLGICEIDTMKTPYYTYAITVTSGTGQVITLDRETVGSVIEIISIKAPSELSVYDLKIYDNDDYFITEEQDMLGSGSITFKKISATILKIKIENATVDGAYSLRVYMRA